MLVRVLTAVLCPFCSFSHPPHHRPSRIATPAATGRHRAGRAQAPASSLTRSRSSPSCAGPRNSTGTSRMASRRPPAPRLDVVRHEADQHKKIVGRAWTAVLRPVLKQDDRAYPNYALQILDEAPAAASWCTCSRAT